MVVGIDSGFYAYPLTDPQIIGGASGNATLSGLDASYVLEAVVGSSVPQIPAFPTTPPQSTAGVDPTVAIPAGLIGVRGQTVNSSVAFTTDAGPLADGLFQIDYPTNFVSINANLVAINSYLASQGWTLLAYSPSPGTLNVGMYNTDGTFLNGGTPELFTMPFVVLQNAPAGTATISLGPASNMDWGDAETMTAVNGSIVLAGAPVAVGNGGNERVERFGGRRGQPVRDLHLHGHEHQSGQHRPGDDQRHQ